MFKKIIVPIDGSEPSWQALEYAEQLGRKFSSELIIAHIIQPFYNAGLLSLPIDNGLFTSQMEEMKKNAEATIDLAKSKLQSYPSPIITKIETGHPSERILNLAEEDGCDVIVIGSRGLSGIAEFVLGSVSATVAQYAKIPVLIVKNQKK